jgi:four helix bundle protein
MPKQDRYNLGTRIENSFLCAFENIISAENLSGTEKLQSLRTAHTKIEILKVHLRLANDQKIIILKDYLSLEEALQEIGKMLGGWIRYIKSN